MRTQPGLAVYPGVAIAVLVFSYNLFGDALRDVPGSQTSRVALAGKDRRTADRQGGHSRPEFPRKVGSREVRCPPSGQVRPRSLRAL